jgi:hypothetical protein
MKQTAVEWLIKKVTNRQNGIFDGFPHLSLDEIYEKAKEMEKQQIIDAFSEGASDGYYGYGDENKEKYYNDTYKKD